MKTLFVSTAALALLTTSLFAAETYKVDKTHSEVGFKVRHLIAKTPGRFNNFSGTIVLDEGNMAASSVEFSIEAASIDTANENRDKHLRSDDFFAAEKYPNITFRSTSVKKKSDTQFEVTGDLTMRGVTKQLTLPVSFNGRIKDAQGRTRAGFDTSTTINRKDYGIEWNRSLDQGGFILGDDVEISISLAGVQQQ